MAPPFRKLSLQEFALLLSKFPFQRKINSVHMHHTWRPNHAQYRGLPTVEAMWRYHTQENGWSDIAQHITIAPDGTIWTGRNWNRAPASASGHNGNAAAGPFMFEMIGDFDHGKDRFEGAQRETALRVIALVQRHFRLPPESLRFHNQMSSKSCPGSSLDYGEIVNAVRALHQAPRDMDVAGDRPGEAIPPFADDALAIRDLIEAVSREGETRAPEPADAEPREGEGQDVFAQYAAGEARSASAGMRAAPELTPAMLEALRPHVVNLAQGRFSTDGRFQTTPSDVDAIFEEHLIRVLDGARARKEKLRLLFYAHGGLVAESNALRMAYHAIPWWQQNHVYPIYFVWETGFFETLRQLLSRARTQTQRAVRDLFDFTTDPVIELLARTLQGPSIWGGMKFSAEQAVDPAHGGAHYLAKQLKKFCDEHRDEVELHAVGHSAGSIFHAYFVPAAVEMGVPSFKTAHLMAPAIRTDTFRSRLRNRIGEGAGIDHLTLYTMRKNWEQADHCAHIYQKSLLYLIYHALEPEPKTPILGLDESLRADPDLRNLFGLGTTPSQKAEVIWSVSPGRTGRSASGSTSHGGFDNDAPTLNSVVRRVCGLDDNDPIAEFPAEAARGVDDWENQVDWPEELAFLSAPEGAISQPAPPPGPPVVSAPAPAPPQPVRTGGKRRALCVGINAYSQAPLAGCVADARAWASTLTRLGFDPPRTLLDEQATRSAILQELQNLITGSQAGDVLVFQYAGHGTQVPDANGDEVGEDTAQDEAICPVDYAQGHFVVDDDLREIFRQIPAGVNVTCFIDCCHSGTISRLGVGSASEGGAAGNERARFLVVSPEIKSKHLEFRRSLGLSRAIGTRGPENMREVVFSACISSEVAWEKDGQGEFTVRATRLLQSGLDGVTHAEFQRQVTEAFGSRPRQHPQLDCAPGAEDRALLQPGEARAGVLPDHQRAAGSNGNGKVLDPAGLARGLRTLAQLLEQV